MLLQTAQFFFVWSRIKFTNPQLNFSHYLQSKFAKQINRVNNGRLNWIWRWEWPEKKRLEFVSRSLCLLKRTRMIPEVNWKKGLVKKWNSIKRTWEEWNGLCKGWETRWRGGRATAVHRPETFPDSVAVVYPEQWNSPCIKNQKILRNDNDFQNSKIRKFEIEILKGYFGKQNPTTFEKTLWDYIDFIRF